MLDHPIARFENLKVEFQTQDGPVEAVKGVSFDIAAGETVAIVGKMHARGPVGATQLTSFKYLVTGEGAIRG